MESEARRMSLSSSSALNKRLSSSKTFGKESSASAPSQKAGKRAPLCDVSNRYTNAATGLGPSATRVCEARRQCSSLAVSFTVKPCSTKSQNNTSVLASHAPTDSLAAHIISRSSAISSALSAGNLASIDGNLSTTSSFKSPEFEDTDSAGDLGCTPKSDADKEMHIVDDIVDVDNNNQDPQSCTTIAYDIYKHLRMAEIKKRPSTNYMEVIQKDINPAMRAILVDWLVEVSTEYRFSPDTLYLTVNYLDRYLSSHLMNRQRLQLLGVACMLIASKYEEICPPQVEEFCYITDNTYFKDEVLQMEAEILRQLKFEMTAPTVQCFLRRFSHVAQRSEETPLLQLEFMVSYIAELTLLEYSLLCYQPSLVAASAVFLAKFILQSTKRPWNATLCHYTLYKPSELCSCVKAIHHLLNKCTTSNLPAIRDKYSQHKYQFVAKKYCPSSIPQEFFHDAVN